MPDWHRVYGTPVRVIKGTCTAETKGVGRIGGPFECVQLPDGELYLQLQAPSLRWDSLARARGGTVGLSGDMFQPIGEIQGRTNRGSPFRAIAYSMAFATHNLSDQSKPLIVQYGLTRAAIGRVPAKEGLRRYAINNILVAGNHLVESKRRIRMPMHFDLPSGEAIDIHRVRDYDLRVRMMTAQKSCAVTGYAETIAPEKDVEMLCAMLSIGHGSMVNWVSKEYLRGERVVATVLTGDRISRPFAGLTLLRASYPGTLPDFVNQIAAGFGATFEAYDIGTIIRLLSHARHGRYADLEARAMLLVIVLEMLTLQFAARENLELRMPKTHFKAVAQRLVSALNDVWNEEPIASPKLQKAAEHWLNSDLNRTSFKQKLLTMASEFDVPPRSGTLTQTVSRMRDTRDSLIHKGRFKRPRNEHVREFFDLLGFVDALVLRLVGYRGTYVTYRDGAFVEEQL